MCIEQRFLLGCVTLDLFAVLLGGATALLPVYARDLLYVGGAPVGPHGLGLMRAAPAVGSALIALGLSRWPLTQQCRRQDAVGGRRLWRGRHWLSACRAISRCRWRCWWRWARRT